MARKMRFQELEKAVFKRLVICLDGSVLSERIIPYARGFACAAGARLKILRVVDFGEDFGGVQRYVDSWCEFLGCEGGAVQIQRDIASTLLGELWAEPEDFPALTTRGHTGVMEPLLGSTAAGVIRKFSAPVLLYHPIGAAEPALKSFVVKSIVAALDGSEYSEKILPIAADFATGLSVKVELIQALTNGDIPVQEIGRDVLEHAYLARCAEHLKNRYSLNVAWDVLHGQPAKAICSYIRSVPGSILALTTHARGPLGQAMLGSVATECVHHVDAPVLIYRPGQA